jgi:diguanylate cyclase (GGDEF)-like protein
MFEYSNNMSKLINDFEYDAKNKDLSEERSLKMSDISSSLFSNMLKILSNYRSDDHITSDLFNNFTKDKTMFENCLIELLLELESVDGKTDSLTGLLNKKYFLELASKKIETSSVCIVMMDIDNFRNINNDFGHQAGDTIIVDIAKIIKEHLRKEDIKCRYGGEEFIFLIDSTMTIVHAAMERLRLKIESYKFNYNDQIINVTASFGMTCGSHSLTKMIKDADDALYLSKNHGKNKISIY